MLKLGEINNLFAVGNKDAQIARMETVCLKRKRTAGGAGSAESTDFRNHNLVSDGLYHDGSNRNRTCREEELTRHIAQLHSRVIAVPNQLDLDRLKLISQQDKVQLQSLIDYQHSKLSRMCAHIARGSEVIGYLTLTLESVVEERDSLWKGREKQKAKDEWREQCTQKILRWRNKRAGNTHGRSGDGAAQQQSSEMTEKLEAVNRELQELHKKLGGAEGRVSSLEAEVEFKDKLTTTLEGDKKELQAKLSGAEGMVSHLETELEVKDKLMTTVEGGKKELQAKLGRAEGMVGRLEKELKVKDKLTATLEGTKKELEAKLTRAEGMVNDLVEQLALKNERKSRRHQKEKQARGEVVDGTDEVNAVQALWMLGRGDNCNKEQDKVASLQQSLAEAKTKLKEAEDKVQNLEQLKALAHEECCTHLELGKQRASMEKNRAIYLQATIKEIVSNMRGLGTTLKLRLPRPPGKESGA